MDNEIDRKIDVTAMQFLLGQNKHQTHDWTLIGSGTTGLGVQEWSVNSPEAVTSVNSLVAKRSVNSPEAVSFAIYL